VNIISTTGIAKRKNDCDDRGAFNLFQDLMHSWVGYELIKVLLIFGLTPKIRDDLEDWSPDLFNVFTYMGNKKRDTNKEKADRVLTILFQKTQHNSYFTNLPFGSKANFEKCPILYYRW
jgi:hypothetical protein